MANPKYNNFRFPALIQFKPTEKPSSRQQPFPKNTFYSIFHWQVAKDYIIIIIIIIIITIIIITIIITVLLLLSSFLTIIIIIIIISIIIDIIIIIIIIINIVN